MNFAARSSSKARGNGKTYCCDACATSHPDNQPCQSGDCNCYRHNRSGIKT